MSCRRSVSEIWPWSAIVSFCLDAPSWRSATELIQPNSRATLISSMVLRTRVSVPPSDPDTCIPGAFRAIKPGHCPCRRASRCAPTSICAVHDEAAAAPVEIARRSMLTAAATTMAAAATQLAGPGPSRAAAEASVSEHTALKKLQGKVRYSFNFPDGWITAYVRACNTPVRLDTTKYFTRALHGLTCSRLEAAVS